MPRKQSNLFDHFPNEKNNQSKVYTSVYLQPNKVCIYFYLTHGYYLYNMLKSKHGQNNYILSIFSKNPPSLLDRLLEGPIKYQPNLRYVISDY
jgi:hypothetical protein